MKTLKVIVMLFAMVSSIALTANAGLTTTGPLDVSAEVGNTLEFVYSITEEPNTTTVTAMNFGMLEVDPNNPTLLYSPKWFEVEVTVSYNTATYTLTSTGTNTGLPAGSIQVNGPRTGLINVAADSGTGVTVASTGDEDKDDKVWVIYCIPDSGGGGVVPSTQPKATYAGTMTISITL